ncbi:EF-hand domain-containing protein [Streptantibioticus cattleyicolor]|uniref:Putative calcium-binding protein n=1 Tax=Streptantibioticus cattleyicolor (strain ATCC 35852 / DSM 46488 / JCM 4925 / NBRC 14057 / NRRL 8057) TaxID=1003195 RepID=F8JKK1_STREN|nr:EF-hand domain-containing protein [Streptantibioticus cattleyicolor]AEW99727.1 putative calcium-binding protein [Streptantibioticus cattleyicolor NRRL 8057 = DSM 46488]CCB71232.1 putative calcium-binding protein [Streptantibioticus cattleyicolor NRRL 8057 = DSM 46488]
MNPTTATEATPTQRVFAMMDTDADGVITADDYLSRIERAVKATGRPDDDPLVATARAQGRTAWTAMDTNGDGRLTFEEYDAWVDGEKFDTICRFALGSLFDLVDTDGDGAVDQAEFTTLRTALNNPPGNARAAFDALDTDGDGRVTRTAYLAAIRAYVTGDNFPMGQALY